MAESNKKFERKSEAFRRQALIEATLAVIATAGIDAATVRTISQQAKVTQGLIRYYFSSKEELVVAAYEYHMTSLTEATTKSLDDMGDACAKVRLAKFIAAALMPPIVNPESVALWAGFMNRVRNDKNMLAIHKTTYLDFRDRIENLIVEAMKEEGIPLEPKQARQLAIAVNAIVDGLWLEGSALPDAFNPEEIVDIGLRSVSAILGIELMKG